MARGGGKRKRLPPNLAGREGSATVKQTQNFRVTVFLPQDKRADRPAAAAVHPT